MPRRGRSDHRLARWAPPTGPHAPTVTFAPGLVPPVFPPRAPPGVPPRMVSYPYGAPVQDPHPGMVCYPSGTPVLDPRTGAVLMGPQLPGPQAFFPGPFGKPSLYPAGPGYPHPGPAAVPATFPAPGPPPGHFPGPFPCPGPVGPSGARLPFGMPPQGNPYMAAPAPFLAPPGHIPLGPTLNMPRELAFPQVPAQQGLNQSAGNVSRGTEHSSQALVPAGGAPAAAGTLTRRGGGRPLIPTVPEFRPASARGLSANERPTGQSAESSISQMRQAEMSWMGPGQPQQYRMGPVAEEVAAAPGPSCSCLLEMFHGPQNTGISQTAGPQDKGHEEEPTTPVQRWSRGGRREPVTPQCAVLDSDSNSPQSLRANMGSWSPWCFNRPRESSRAPISPGAMLRTQDAGRLLREAIGLHELETVAPGVGERLTGERLTAMIQLGRALLHPQGEAHDSQVANADLESFRAIQTQSFRSGQTSTDAAAGQTRAADPSEERLVSTFERVFENLDTYPDGYSDCQGLPRDANTVGTADVPGRLPRHQPSWRSRPHHLQVPEWENPEVLNDPDVQRYWLNDASAMPNIGPSGTDRALHTRSPASENPPSGAPTGPATMNHRQEPRTRRFLSPRGRGLQATGEEGDAFHGRLDRVLGSPWQPAPRRHRRRL